MQETGLETSLIETGWQLLQILIGLVGVAVIAGVFTLPLFYGTLAYKVTWFWSREAAGTFVRKVVGFGLQLGLPVFSLFATILSFGYFGAFDYPHRVVTGLPSSKKGPVQRVVSEKFDNFTREVGQRSAPLLPPDVSIKWARCPDKALELALLWEQEQKPPEPSPLEKLFPPGQPVDLPEGPQAVPKAVVDKVRELVAQEQAGTLYTGNDRYELTKEQVLVAEYFYDRAVKESKLMQDRMVQGMRGVILYFCLILGPIPLFIFTLSLIIGKQGVLLILRSLIRSLLRTSLTYLAVFVLVFMLCGIWSVLDFLSALTKNQESNLRAIITEKHQIPSQMKPSHLQGVKEIMRGLEGDQKVDNVDKNVMTWAFVLGTLDPTKRTAQNQLFLFALEPEAVLTMMPGLEDCTGEELAMLEKATAEMKRDPRAVVIGADKLRQMGKRVGDTMRVTSLNYKGITFDYRIIAEFPLGTRWENSAVMTREYLDKSLEAYEGMNGKKHDLHDKCMNLIWIRLPNQKAFETVSNVINDPKKSRFTPAIKMEIESSAYANFLSPFKTLLSFMRYALAPGLLVITTLVCSLVIGIGVRERRTEIAVLKVLGFRPWMVLGLIMGEALLIGTMSGFMSTATAYSMVNAMGGIPLPIGFFGKFFIPEDALWWGPGIGALTSFIGAILPSVNTYLIKASQVFSRVT